MAIKDVVVDYYNRAAAAERQGQPLPAQDLLRDLLWDMLSGQHRAVVRYCLENRRTRDVASRFQMSLQAAWNTLNGLERQGYIRRHGASWLAVRERIGNDRPDE